MEIKKCPICGKSNPRGGISKYCSGDCKQKADRMARKKKNQELAEKRRTTLAQDKRSEGETGNPSSLLTTLDKVCGYAIMKTGCVKLKCQ